MTSKYTGIRYSLYNTGKLKPTLLTVLAEWLVIQENKKATTLTCTILKFTFVFTLRQTYAHISPLDAG